MKETKFSVEPVTELKCYLAKNYSIELPLHFCFLNLISIMGNSTMCYTMCYSQFGSMNSSSCELQNDIHHYFTHFSLSGEQTDLTRCYWDIDFYATATSQCDVIFKGL